MTEAPMYTVGGTVQAGGGLYVPRPADDELLRLCRAGGFGYVLTPRQLGKSSLMVRTADCLAAEGVRTAVIDLTVIGTEVTADQWYLGLIDILVGSLAELRGAVDYAAWWQGRAHLGLAQRLSQFLRDVVLAQIDGRVVVFVDEIDTTLSLDFTDDFFAAIRACYNARAADPTYARLAFVLLGVAVPDDLIRDPRRTPFNIGQRIDLDDFTLEQALPLAAGLGADPGTNRRLLERVLYWTDGHPYLTQKSCKEVARAQVRDAAGVDRLIHGAFLSPSGRDEANLARMRRQIIDSSRASELLELYLRSLSREVHVPDSERSIVTNTLKLTGIVKADAEHWLRVRNRIYATVFDRPWAQATYGEIVGRGQVRFEQLLAEAEALFERKEYAGCLRKLEILREVAPEFPRGDLEQRARDGQATLELAALYEQAARDLEAHAYGTALETMSAIHGRRPNYPDPHDVEKRAREAVERQNRLHAAYEQGVAAFQAENWAAAASSFEALLAEEPGYQDTKLYLSQTQRMGRLAGLLVVAVAASQAGEYEACLDALGELRTVDPEYEREQVTFLRDEACKGLWLRAERLLAEGQIDGARGAAGRLEREGWSKKDLAELNSRINAGWAAREQARRARMRRVLMAVGGSVPLIAAACVLGIVLLINRADVTPTPVETSIGISTHQPTLWPTDTAPPTETGTAEPTPTGTPSPTPEPVLATSVGTVYLYAFPVGGAEQIGKLTAGETVTIMGRWPAATGTAAADRWLYVQTASGERGFAVAGGFELQGVGWDALLPVEIGVPTATATHTVTPAPTPIVRVSGVTRLTTDARSEYVPSYSPDGTLITFQREDSLTADGSQNWEIYVMNADGSQPRNLSQSSATDYHSHFSPDGDQVVFTSNRRGGGYDIYTVDVAGTFAWPVVVRPGDQMYPSFSPDGKSVWFMGKVALPGGTANQWEVFRAHIASGQVFTVTNDLANDEYPAAAPDGRSIVFQSDRDGNWEIYRLDLLTLDTTRLTCGKSREAQPAVSPDGRWIVFESNISGNYDIYVEDWAGSVVWALTTDPAYDQLPSFAPDGSGVIFQSDRAGQWDLYVTPFDSLATGRAVALTCPITGPVPILPPLPTLAHPQ